MTFGLKKFLFSRFSISFFLSRIWRSVPTNNSSTPLLRTAEVSVYLHSYFTAIPFASENILGQSNCSRFVSEVDGLVISKKQCAHLEISVWFKMGKHWPIDAMGWGRSSKPCFIHNENTPALTHLPHHAFYGAFARLVHMSFTVIIQLCHVLRNIEVVPHKPKQTDGQTERWDRFYYLNRWCGR